MILKFWPPEVQIRVSFKGINGFLSTFIIRFTKSHFVGDRLSVEVPRHIRLILGTPILIDLSDRWPTDSVCGLSTPILVDLTVRWPPDCVLNECRISKFIISCKNRDFEKWTIWKSITTQSGSVIRKSPFFVNWAT